MASGHLPIAGAQGNGGTPFPWRDSGKIPHVWYFLRVPTIEYMKAHPMSDAREQYTPPTIDERGFNCPHCGVLAAQQWFRVGASHAGDHTPLYWQGCIAEFVPSVVHARHPRLYNTYMKNRGSKRPFLFDLSPELGLFHTREVYGIWFSQCFHCEEFAVWIDRSLAWPQQRGAPLPNSDLPDDVRADYEEASSIVNLSPRGAAALLRLGIQKLCRHLGGKGNINDDVSALVKGGLRVEVQQALDAIRVIGNNSVHPGQLDLRDDHATARSLFDLVNLIANAMISEPKRVSEIYENLPKGAREAIKRRDAQ